MWAIDRRRAESHRLIGPRTLPVDATGLRYGGSGSTVRASFRELESMKDGPPSRRPLPSPAGRLLTQSHGGEPEGITVPMHGARACSWHCVTPQGC